LMKSLSADAYFFFHAEDGIRAFHVTGVQTCALPIFASGERGTPWGALSCELRSVNHRFLETGLRLADELRTLEPVLRERVAARVQRGKLDLVMRLRAPEAASSLTVNEALLGQLGELARDRKSTRLNSTHV